VDLKEAVYFLKQAKKYRSGGVYYCYYIGCDKCFFKFNGMCATKTLKEKYKFVMLLLEKKN
jgi:hypothetical protein